MYKSGMFDLTRGSKKNLNSCNNSNEFHEILHDPNGLKKLLSFKENKYHYFVTPGLFGPLASIRPVHLLLMNIGIPEDQLHLVQIPNNVTGLCPKVGQAWFSEFSDNKVAAAAENNLIAISQTLSFLNTETAIEYVRQKFGLDQTVFATSIAEYLVARDPKGENFFNSLLFSVQEYLSIGKGITDPVANIPAIGPFLKEAQDSHNLLFSAVQAWASSSTLRAQNEVRVSPYSKIRNRAFDKLVEFCFEHKGRPAHHQERHAKLISHHILDQVLPRKIYIGHSLGGYVSTLDHITNEHSIALNLPLSAPIGGITYEMSFAHDLHRFIPLPFSTPRILDLIPALWTLLRQQEALSFSGKNFGSTYLSSSVEGDTLVTQGLARMKDQDVNVRHWHDTDDYGNLRLGDLVPGAFKAVCDIGERFLPSNVRSGLVDHCAHPAHPERYFTSRIKYIQNNTHEMTNLLHHANFSGLQQNLSDDIEREIYDKSERGTDYLANRELFEVLELNSYLELPIENSIDMRSQRLIGLIKASRSEC